LDAKITIFEPNIKPNCKTGMKPQALYSQETQDD